MTAMKHSPLAPKIWKRDEILSFLDVFEATFHASVSDPFDSEAEMWECISSKLSDQNITASARHCQSKWNLLYKTYMNNQNHQGVFFSKIKQIVQFSQQLGDSDSIEIQDEQIPVSGQDVVVAQENMDESEKEETEERQNCDELEETHLNDNAVQTIDTKTEESPSKFSIKRAASPIETEDIPFLEIPLKRVKIENNQSSKKITQHKEQVLDVVLEAPSDESESGQTQKQPNPSDITIDLKDFVLSLASKMEHILKVQLELNQRLERLENLQIENNQLLSEIHSKISQKR
ncbi:uncharacterized protein LOC129744145 isoform X2 [Uranotaenia lowii]|uniref:uncharacterized protein LOC129744145 isoform X2 n=1 Tax=Uranotaenia lowii TaxID=190385 RepID=UPI0024785457|nr:uncharacterized protein LOC129744145 isoform X2 [Uranotaenia lowii]